jgi:hypothetical protein
MSDINIFKNNLDMFIEQFFNLHGIDEKELKFSEILEYIIANPDPVRMNHRFRETILDRIRRNHLCRHFRNTGISLLLEEVNNWELLTDSPNINYNRYYYIFQHL